jgi:hypothetical protein
MVLLSFFLLHRPGTNLSPSCQDDTKIHELLGRLRTSCMNRISRARETGPSLPLPFLSTRQSGLLTLAVAHRVVVLVPILQGSPRFF